jgi:hypothetical protein
MRSIFLCGLICGSMYLGAIAKVDAAQYVRPGGESCGCGCDSSCGGGHNWWSLQGEPCQNGGCGEDCGHPYRLPCARSCDPCGNGCRPLTCKDKTYCGPLTPIFALFTRDCWSGSACTERYWGDFYGDPPDFCDPCDRCGNYTGGWNGWNGGGGSGCNCGGGQRAMEQTSPVPMEGRVISQGNRVSRQIPTPASKTRKTVNQ